MMTTRERISSLESRVGTLETWAGPGQAKALSDGLRDLRTSVGTVRLEQARHTRQLESLRSDVGTLKTDVAELKTGIAAVQGDVAEILRRLPDKP